MASVLAATKSQNTRILQLLLQGPTSTQDVQQALFYACQEGLAECVQCLISSGLDPNLRNNSDNGLLHLAVTEGHAGVVDVLCRAGADVNARGSGNNTPIHIASRWGKDECLEILLQNSCALNSKDSTQSTPLILAVKNKQYVAIRQLLDAGCNVNLTDKSGRTALHFASLTGTAVEQVIRAGADVNICDIDGCSPLLYAATEGLERVVSCLTRVPGCDVNIAPLTVGRTPLHILAYKGHDRSVQDLVDAGACPRLLDAESKTALWYAVANGHFQVARVLLRSSFNVESFKCSSDVKSANTCPVQLAVDKGLSDVLKLFVLTCYDSDHLRECLNQSKARELFSGATGWDIQGQQVPTLQQTCRKWIRHHLRSTVISRIFTLPIPNKFIDYILMTELEDNFET